MSSEMLVIMNGGAKISFFCLAQCAATCANAEVKEMSTQSPTNLLDKYKQNVENIRKAARELNLTEREINNLFEECFQELKNEDPSNSLLWRLFSRLFNILKVLCVFTLIFLIVFIILNHHQPTLSLVLRNVQGFIYPGLKMLRLLAIPVITLFPNLSELYDETCLIENPYFQVTNMECWPCEHVHSVINLTESKNYTLSNSGIPYIIQTLNSSVSLQDLKKLYQNNSDIFYQDAQKLKSNNHNFAKIKDIMHFSNNNSDTHITWRINRMTPARLIRKLFPKPSVISDWSGQSTERFIMIDDLKAGPYILPNPECSFVLYTQGSGERTIVLKPSQECSKQCRVTSVTMKPTYTLAYNWWYWRPISLPTLNSSDISVSYISSFC